MLEPLKVYIFAFVLSSIHQAWWLHDWSDIIIIFAVNCLLVRFCGIESLLSFLFSLEIVSPYVIDMFIEVIAWQVYSLQVLAHLLLRWVQIYFIANWVSLNPCILKNLRHQTAIILLTIFYYKLVTTILNQGQ